MAVWVSCIVRLPPLIPGLCLPRLQGRVVRTDCSGFAILMRNNCIMAFVDIGFFWKVFLKSPLPCSSIVWLL
jgi:hypothetical protein